MPSICSNMIDLEMTLLRTEVGERQIQHDSAYVWDLNCDANGLTYKTETRVTAQKRGLWLPRGRGRGGRRGRESGIGRRKLSPLEWVRSRARCVARGTISVSYHKRTITG